MALVAYNTGPLQLFVTILAQHRAKAMRTLADTVHPDFQVDWCRAYDPADISDN